MTSKELRVFGNLKLKKGKKFTFLIFHRNGNEIHISRAGSFPKMEVEQRLRGRIVRRPKEQVWMLKTDSVLNIINIYIDKAQTNSMKWIQGASKYQI